MKKLITTIVVLTFAANISAQQQYQRCLDGEVVKWSILYEVLDYGKNSDNWIAYGNTILNDKTYKPLVQYRFESRYGDWKDYIPDGLSAEEWFIRENEDASQLYILDTYSNKEYLIMDLNLEVGDVFQRPEIWNFWSPPTENKFIVDSVYMRDGLKHIRFDYEIGYKEPWDNGDWNKLTFIEGIGPNVVFPISHLILNQLLNCFQNESLFYKNENIKLGDGSECPCGYQTLSNAVYTPDLPKDYIIRINENHIEIDFITNTDAQLSIYDISGRLCYTANWISEKNGIIPTASFSKGIYLLKIFNKNRNTTDVDKIILYAHP